jgi:hypothetical protein
LPVRFSRNALQLLRGGFLEENVITCHDASTSARRPRKKASVRDDAFQMLKVFGILG